MTFQVIGHRGAAGHAPENTAPSFELAIALGVDAIELDIHLSRDGIPVVIHDASVDRTTDGSGEVGDLTAAELKSLDAGGWFAPEYSGTRLLVLEEALELIGGRVPVVIEIKERRRVPELLDACRSPLGGLEPGLIALSSFSLEALAEAERALPDLPKEWLIRRDSFDFEGAYEAARHLSLSRLCPHALEVDKTWVDKAANKGMGVRVWGIPSAETRIMVRAMRSVIRSGAQGATADFPDALISTRKAMGL